jgi:hypothetical protein
MPSDRLPPPKWYWRENSPTDALPRAASAVGALADGGGVRQAATGISKIDELVNTFIDAEDQNFSLFNYVNELNNEVPSHARTHGRPRYPVPTML